MSDRIVGSVERDERNNGREQDKYVPRQRGNDKETTEISISLDKDLYARQTSRFSFFDQPNEPAKKSVALVLSRVRHDRVTNDNGHPVEYILY